MKQAWHICVFILFLLTMTVGGAGQAGPPKDIVIEPGREEADPHLGYGWSTPEKIEHRRFRWIDRLDADVLFELTEPSDLKFSLTASAMYITWRRQMVGVYINNHFVSEWIMPNNPHVAHFNTTIPRKFVAAGKNRITLRMGYQFSVPPDPRKLALAVDRIEIQPR